MSNTGWAAVIIILVILLGGGWWWYSSQNATPATDTTAGVGGAAGTFPEGTPEPQNGMVGGDADPGSNAGSNAANTVVVRYTASGFVPATVTIRQGQAVRWVNETSGRMWIGADEHPTHTEFDGTDRATHCSGTYTGPTPFDQCQAGAEYTFVFNKAGTFGYHNHSAAQHSGTVVVQ